MELLNNEFRKVCKNTAQCPQVFKQDPKLTFAINKLFMTENAQLSENGPSKILELPERKLDFNEVRKLVLQQDNTMEADMKPPEEILKETNDKRKEINRRIEDILDQINRSAENGEVPKLIIRNQRLWSNCIYDFDRVTLKSYKDARKTVVTYSRNDDKIRFHSIVFVLTKVHELMSKNIIVTRRELFYQNVTRLRQQSTLDTAVRDACCLLDTPPWELGIAATAKGLVAGPLTMVCRDGREVDCMATGGTLVPQDVVGIREFKSTAKYILVVEKDAIFQKLLDEGALLRLGPVIIITGKGYPDVCTRQLLARVRRALRLPALALVDPDPHGMEIFLTYKYGSLAQSHLSASLACPALRLLGGRHADILALAATDARMVLTARDRGKLAALLQRPYLDTPIGAAIKRELSSMLRGGVKAELEALAPTGPALCDAYLPAKIMQADFLG